jgi:MFS family permease
MKARHIVLSILFVTWITSEMDRMAMSVALPYISSSFHLHPLESGILLSAFFGGYSISQIPGGFLADKFGVRRVATVAMLWWSGFTAITGAATNFAQMLICRFVFGLGEGIFPACAFKTIAVWFPKRERATANAIMLASNPLGLALSPLAVVGIMSFWGWRAVFYSLFFPGVIISAIFWLFVSDKPTTGAFVSREEATEIEGRDADNAGDCKEDVGISRVVRQPSILRYFFVLFTFDIAFWGFTSWLPTYLVKARGLSMVQMGVVASLPYFAGTIGGVVGGFVSDRYFYNNRRLLIVITELIAALLLYFTFTAASVMALVAYQTIAGFFLMLFFSAFWALPMNTVPKSLMGVASGFLNMAGQIAAFISPVSFGYLVELGKGSFHLTLLLLIGLLFISCVIALTIPSTLGSRCVAPVHS